MLTNFRFTIKYPQTKKARKALGIKPQALQAFLSLLKIYQKIVSVGSRKKLRRNAELFLCPGSIE
jgi:hypothetical protein